MEKEIKFEDAQELKKQYPETFYAPSSEDLKQIKPGDFVKICAYQERFWAEVISVNDDAITARVDNVLLMWHLKYNDIITFKTYNVYAILPKAAFIKNCIRQKNPGKSKGRGAR